MNRAAGRLVAPGRSAVGNDFHPTVRAAIEACVAAP
jgi:hypothetical protein